MVNLGPLPAISHMKGWFTLKTLDLCVAKSFPAGSSYIFVGSETKGGSTCGTAAGPKRLGCKGGKGEV